MDRARGIDVSHWQGDIDWAKVGKAGLDFAVVKATEGTVVDEQFTRNRAGASKAGLIVGMYHFGHPSNDPVAEANHFTATVGTLHKHELPLILDLEADDARPRDHVQNWGRKFLATVHNKTGRLPIVYTYPYFISDTLNGSLTDYPLWIASYREKPEVPSWDRWHLWQHTASGVIPGIGGKVDLDWFHGSREELRRSVGLDAPKPSPHQFPGVLHREDHAAPRGPVAELQKRLTRLGFPLKVDGIFGPRTETGVGWFQSARPPLPRTGVVDRATWKALWV